MAKVCSQCGGMLVKGNCSQGCTEGGITKKPPIKCDCGSTRYLKPIIDITKRHKPVVGYKCYACTPKIHRCFTHNYFDYVQQGMSKGEAYKAAMKHEKTPLQSLNVLRKTR